MRVIFINSIYPNPAEPMKGNFVLKNLAHYPKDVDVEVIAPVGFFVQKRRKSSERVPFVRYENFEGRKIRIWHPRFLLLPRNLLRAFVPAFERLAIEPILRYLNKRKKIDVLHVNFCFPDGVAVASLARKMGIPYVITEHQAVLETLLSIKYMNKLMLPAYHGADKIIAVSDHTRNIILSHGVSKNNVVVVPNGIDTDLFTPHASGGEIKKLIYIGYLVEHKGVHVLLEALSKVGDSSLKLSIVGDGVYREELERLTVKYELQEQVDFLGSKTASEVAQLLKEHDALVHPSFIESFGITVIESMASGLPALATRNGGSEYIITDETGIIVPPKDSDAFAEGIKLLISTDWDREHIREYATENYDIRSVVRKTIELYPKPKHEPVACHISSVHKRNDVRIFYKQCTSLEKAGYKVHLLVADGMRHERKDGIIIQDVGTVQSRIQRMLVVPFRLLRKALYIQADIYQIHDPELIPMAIVLKLISRKPVVYDMHESYSCLFTHKEYMNKLQSFIFSKGIRIVENTALKILDKVITVTEHISKMFGGIPVIHNYPILAEWEDVSVSKERYESRNVCYLGSITRERGIFEMVNAIENIDCTLHLAGRFEEPEVREEVSKLPGFSKVVEHGFINRKQAAELLGSCALGIHPLYPNPNYTYSLPTKMLEYMAASLPILASNIPINMELLDSSKGGRYVDPKDVKALSQGIEEMLSDPDMLAQQGLAGKNFVFSQMSWEAEQEKYLQIYSELLNKEIN
ncbi:MAG: glycosyltransferase [Candidatus Cloacimonadaceae bacterium]